MRIFLKRLKKIFIHSRANFFGGGISFLVIVCLFLLSQTEAVKSTGAISYDREKSGENSFVAGTLDLSLQTEADFAPPIKPDQPAERNITVKKETDPALDYELEIINTDGDLCSNLKLKADWKNDGSDEYDGNLDDFISALENLESDDLWKFTVSLKDDASEWENKKCEFDIRARAQQSYGLGQGFTDYEVIHNIVETGIWTEDLGITAPAGLMAPASGEIIEEIMETPESNLGGDGAESEAPPIESEIPPEAPVESEMMDGLAVP